MNKDNYCNHLKTMPTYKIEGGCCMKCATGTFGENYCCLSCLDQNYNKHILHPIGKKYRYELENKKIYKKISNEKIVEYREKEMLSICYDCVEKLNHPSIGIIFKHHLCGCLK